MIGPDKFLTEDETMNLKRICTDIFLLLILCAMVFSWVGFAARVQQSPQEIFQRVHPSIVRVEVPGESGTGSLISSNGCILTAAHVVKKEGATDIIAHLYKSETGYWQSNSYEAELISFQAKSDFAIIRIDITDAPWIAIGDSDLVRQLDDVISIGFPRPSVIPTDVPLADRGNVQAIRQDPMEFEFGFGRDLYFVSLERAIQVSGTIRPGSSGGPILNANGEIVSIISTVPKTSELSNTAYTSAINRAGIPRVCSSMSGNSGLPSSLIALLAVGMVIIGSFGYWGYRRRNKVDVNKLLRSVSLFSDLADEELQELRESCETKSFKKNDKLIREGELDQDEMFLILSGQVDIQSQGKSIAKRGKGRIIGEASMLSKEPRSADVLATESTNCLSLSKENLRELIRAHPEIAMKMMEDLTRRLREANELLN
jgi:hypothetical protein